METIRDRTTLGAFAGVAAILIRDVYSLVAKLVGFAKFYVWNIAADLSYTARRYKPLRAVLGILADMGTGALLGVLFVHFLRWTGGKNPLIKGVGLGIGAWLFYLASCFTTCLVRPVLHPIDVTSNLSGLIGHAIFGFALGYFTEQAPPASGSGTSSD